MEMSGKELLELRDAVFTFNNAAARYDEAKVEYEKAWIDVTTRNRDMVHLLYRLYGVPFDELPPK
jgi:hypothetical protein